MREQGHIRAALDCYQQALKLNPNLSTALGNFGLLLTACGDLETGLQHCRKAVELRPNDVPARYQLGKMLLEFGHIEEAMEVLSDVVETDPDNAELAVTVGRVWIELGDLRQARSWFERALQLEPDLNEAQCGIAQVLREAGDPEAAIQAYQKVLEKEPGRMDAQAGLARAFQDHGDMDLAVATYRETIRQYPESASLHACLGHAMAEAGDLDEAVNCHRRAITLNPRCVPALSGLATTLRGRTSDEELGQLEKLLNVPWMTDGRRAALNFGLAQAFDGKGDYQRAAVHIKDANEFQKKHYEQRDQGYSAEVFREHVDRLIETFTPEYFERVSSLGFGVGSERPVFIVGMPRSGTTLTEQILATHPRAFGAGERSFIQNSLQLLPTALQLSEPPLECLKRITAEAVGRLTGWHLDRLRGLDSSHDRVVDKMPDNYQFLGWIATLHPQAKIIHCQRDIRDVAFSCWITNFARIRWANDLEHLAQRVIDYQRLMNHYRQVLPIPVLEVSYEQMIANQEEATRRLLDFVGLEWDPNCLDFHKTERLVRTASVAQVRQPIYKRSVARWKYYEAALKAFLEALHFA
ncbi:MAG: sulfotransferase [Fuerstiella sp.]